MNKQKDFYKGGLLLESRKREYHILFRELEIISGRMNLIGMKNRETFIRRYTFTKREKIIEKKRE